MEVPEMKNGYVDARQNVKRLDPERMVKEKRNSHGDFKKAQESCLK